MRERQMSDGACLPLRKPRQQRRRGVSAAVEGKTNGCQKSSFKEVNTSSEDDKNCPKEDDKSRAKEGARRRECPKEAGRRA
jgi:hypothetical protein